MLIGHDRPCAPARMEIGRSPAGWVGALLDAGTIIRVLIQVFEPPAG